MHILLPSQAIIQSSIPQALNSQKIPDVRLENSSSLSQAWSRCQTYAYDIHEYNFDSIFLPVQSFSWPIRVSCRAIVLLALWISRDEFAVH